LIHVVEYLPVTLDNELIAPLSVDVEKQLVENARRQLEEYATRVGLAECQRRVEMGSAKLEILRVAEEAGVDLIVVGRHGRHGLARLLGSTASAVVHAASCDVLAVKIGN
jgi:universal stress protein A